MVALSTPRQCIPWMLGALLIGMPFTGRASSAEVSARPLIISEESDQTGDTILDRVVQSAIRHDLRLSAASSCAAAACHGGAHPGIDRPSASRGAEYPLWLARDPHARSWQTLCSAKSVNILRRLKILDEDAIIDQAGFDECLACHNTTKHSHESRRTGHITEGVGCAACHGPDEAWREEHYQSPCGVFYAEGFVQNRDLLTRARICASCHVGDRNRDMHHDMIAAGHPPLRYEFATYHARLPKHWREEQDEDFSEVEARLWLLGQITAFDASLTLLEARARAAPRTRRWPEFAEFDCASCHHDLRAPIEDAVPRIDVHPTYSAWLRTGLQLLLDHRIAMGVSALEDRQLRQCLHTLQQVVESKQTPDPDATANAAKDTRLALDRWLQSDAGKSVLRDWDVHQLSSMVHISSDRAAKSMTWEEEVQLYLAQVAARAAVPHADRESVWEELRRWRTTLQFPPGRESPSRN